MVAFNVPTLFGVRRPHYALPLLYEADNDLARGDNLAAAARIREALRRWLHAECEANACLPKRPTIERMLRVLTRKGAPGCWEFVEDVLADAEDVLSFRRAPYSLRCALECAVDLVAPCAFGDWRDDDDGDAFAEGGQS